MKRLNRPAYLAAVFVTMAAGFSSRKFAALLPDIIASHAGDLLWASMVYFGIRFLFAGKPRVWAVWGSLLFSCGIEFSQLCQADWIVALRRTPLGALVLGRGFLVVDLFRYIAGIALAYGADRFGLDRWKHKRRE